MSTAWASKTVQNEWNANKELREQIIESYHTRMLTQAGPPSPIMRAMRKAAFTVGKRNYA